jgi:signal transduction histidine kinase
VARPRIVNPWTAARHSVFAPTPCQNQRVVEWVAASRRGPLRLAAAAGVLAYAVATVAIPRSATVPTTNGGVSVLAHVADLAAGLGLLAAGLVALTEPRTRRLGILACLAGVVWFGPDWEGWDGGSVLPRSLGAAVAPLFVAFVFHIVLAFPSGRLRSRFGRRAVLAVYTLVAVTSAVRGLFRDPFLDPYCWRNCVGNSFALRSDARTTRVVGDVSLRVSLAIGLLLVVIAVWKLVAATRARRHHYLLWPGLVPGALVGAAAVTYAIALWRDPLEGRQSGEFRANFLALSFSVSALAVGLAWNVVHIRRTRGSVARLVTELGEAPRPGRLQEALAAAVGDPGLSLHYWLPDAGIFVDWAGRYAPLPAPRNGRVATSITRSGHLVAAVSHDAALLDGPDLEREIGSAARLAVENERLQAAVLAQLAALRESRARIVHTADAERRRLERDLHDGAQQRLLALSYQLRLAHADAESDGDREVAALLASAGEEARAALDELRQLAQGIYPAVLTEAGLGLALATLADTASLPVELTDVTHGRYPAPVETAAYATIAEAIEDAVTRGATFVSVEARQQGDRLVIVTEDDGEERGSPMTYVDDRVGAVGGSVETGPRSLRAALPCA